jgi:hypothetical protein
VGYDIHIVRTKDWVEASSNPITKEDVDAVIASDRELAWSTSDYALEADGSRRYDAITWNGAPSFWWHHNKIVCKTPNEKQIIKLVRMAQLLGAYCVGDDGERYELKRGFLGKEKLVILHAE